MSTSSEPMPMTVEQWQAIATPRTELYNGFEYDLRARYTTARHAAICCNVTASISRQLDKCGSTSCNVLAAGPIVRIADNEARIPDVSVECTRQADTDPMHIQPCIVVEVLSPTTSIYDMTTKRDNYMTQDCIDSILLIDDDNNFITHDYRGSNGTWIQQVHRLQ